MNYFYKESRSKKNEEVNFFNKESKTYFSCVCVCGGGGGGGGGGWGKGGGRARVSESFFIKNPI